MIRHIDTATAEILEFKEKNPKRYKELIDSGIRIGFGEVTNNFFKNKINGCRNS